jgi:putative oxidoreductase
MGNFWITWQPKILSLLRFIAGFLMLWHGSQKLFGFPPSGKSVEMPAFIQYGAGGIEFFVGILIMIGLFTRWSSFLLSGTMAVAYWMAHGLAFTKPDGPGAIGFLPVINGGELAVLYCFVYLYLFFAGGGEWSLDNLLKKKN